MNEIGYDPIVSIPTIGEKGRSNLNACGYETVDDLREADIDELKSVPYIGENKAEFIYHYLND